MKNSDAAADDVEGSGVAVTDAAAADVEACGVADDAWVTNIPGMKISDKVVSCSVCGVEGSGVAVVTVVAAADDDDADACGGGKFNALNLVIAAADVDGSGDADMGG